MKVIREKRRKRLLKSREYPDLESCRAAVDERLSTAFVLQEENALKGFSDAMRYSLLAGGKRIRAALVLEFCRICGGDTESAMDIACAVEMLHTYSLIHDDLPCMDNDSLRRGKPTNHVVYGECVATLAGDALQAEAFRRILSSSVSDMARLRCAGLLADAVGLDGMCGGQYLDMLGEGEKLTVSQLDAINSRKTGALLAASCAMGVAAADGTEDQENAARRYGELIGLAFQIRDDMLDVLSTESELGKPIGSDAAENKNTYMALLGQSACEAEITRLSNEAVGILHEEFSDTAFLEDLTKRLATRKK